VTARDGTTSQWRSPGGVPLDIAAAVPYAGYTDVINVMAPNGRAGDGIFAANGDRLRPAGIPDVPLDALLPQSIATNAMMVAPANPAAGTDAFFRVASLYGLKSPVLGLAVGKQAGDQGDPPGEAFGEHVLVGGMRPFALGSEAVERGDADRGSEVAIRPTAGAALLQVDDTHARCDLSRLCE
jgi:hypothetical protein